MAMHRPWRRFVFPCDPILWLRLWADDEYGTEANELNREQCLEALAIAFQRFHIGKAVIAPGCTLAYAKAESIRCAAKLALER